MDINGRTIIDGFISPQRNSIGLNIKARNTRLEFMQDFCKSFLKDVDLYGDGDVTLSGDLSELELLGEIVAHGQLTVTSTNCKYSMMLLYVTYMATRLLCQAEYIISTWARCRMIYLPGLTGC